jgi:hypothetical protein
MIFFLLLSRFLQKINTDFHELFWDIYFSRIIAEKSFEKDFDESR